MTCRALVLLLLLGLAACEYNPLETYAWHLSGGGQPDRAAAPVPPESPL